MKKIVTTMLTLAVCLLLCVNAAAFVPQKIKSLSPQFLAQLSDIRFDDVTVGLGELQNLDAHPGSNVEIILSGKDEFVDLFLDQNGEPINSADVTISKMRASGVVAKIDFESGEDTVDNVEVNVINGGSPTAKPVLRINFATEFTSLYPTEFAATVSIHINGRQEQSIDIGGTFGNINTNIYASDDSVSANSAILLASEDIPSIVIDAGYNVFAEAELQSGERYFISATASEDSEDLELLESNENVVDVITLETIGFKHGQIKKVRIESQQNLVVYDADGKKLGTTDQDLPLSEKYYLSQRDFNF